MSTTGITEADICAGGRLRASSVILEVPQLRQPCWKLNDRFNTRGTACRVQRTARTGQYYRAPEGGALRAGDTLEWFERPWPQWSLLRVLDVFYRNMPDRAALTDILRLPLTPSWRKLVEGRLAHGEVESWARRIDGPALDAWVLNRLERFSIDAGTTTSYSQWLPTCGSGSRNDRDHGDGR